MCNAMHNRLLSELGMRLAGQEQHRAALMLLALALRGSLRRSLRSGACIQEARIRNNMALVLQLAGRPYLARRQFVRAMGLVALRVGTDNQFYRLLQANLAGTLHQGDDHARQAA